MVVDISLWPSRSRTSEVSAPSRWCCKPGRRTSAAICICMCTRRWLAGRSPTLAAGSRPHEGGTSYFRCTPCGGCCGASSCKYATMPAMTVRCCAVRPPRRANASRVHGAPRHHDWVVSPPPIEVDIAHVLIVNLLSNAGPVIAPSSFQGRADDRRNRIGVAADQARSLQGSQTLYDLGPNRVVRAIA